ncbi:hypothetical protein Poli38472_003087 [Pythium oligandrum]|uniref:C2 NT-type domain-containing protein n=1 Tax=Pythium oligandrum TaxID=41045 RepID=A0A8K1C6Y3_PYTOL|nr:hypothetical protein Poli38472_003087 [Pythium oligandrum]|eukprot:TMW57162.1 hypothetical protein Poli38472_003087 [Pythium oligandrum]
MPSTWKLQDFDCFDEDFKSRSREVHILVEGKNDKGRWLTSRDNVVSVAHDERDHQYTEVYRITAERLKFTPIVNQLVNAIDRVKTLDSVPFIALESSQGVGKTQMAFNLMARSDTDVFYAVWNMNHLIQVARRTGKHAVGYKVQLVIHRMNALLPATYNNVELSAVITRHKKRVVTKSGAYSLEKKEVVWGDILPFTCTLYLAKTGLFQAKVFQVQVFDTRTDQQIATFEFNLAELVQSNKESSKESIMVPALKCQDHRASLSLTVIGTKVMGGGRAPRSPGDPEGSNADEVSFDGSRSDMSAITLESHGSRASMASRNGRKTSNPTSPQAAEGDHKSDGVRGAYPASDNDALELYNLRNKHKELLHTVSNLEEQLRQTEGENVKLENKVSEQQAAIEKLTEEKAALERQVFELEVKTEHQSSTNSDSDDDMKIDFMKYRTLREEKGQVELELKELKTTMTALQQQLEEKQRVGAHIKEEGSDAEDDKEDEKEDEEEEQEEEDDNEAEEVKQTPESKHSEASSADEFVDAHDAQLMSELHELRHSLESMQSARDQYKASMDSLTIMNEKLTEQVRELMDKVGDLETENADQKRRLHDQQAQIDRNKNEFDEEAEELERSRATSTEVQRENEKLVEQLSHFDQMVSRLKKEKDELLHRLQEAEGMQSRAQRDMDDAHSTMSQLKEENSGLSGKLDAAQEASERAKQEIESAQLTIDELRAQVREISEQLQSTQEELAHLRNEELVSSAAAAAAAIAKNQELQERWDDLKQQNDQLQSRVDELEERLTRTDMEGQEKEVELQRQVAELKQETAQLREELEELLVSKKQAEEELHDRTMALKQALENQNLQLNDHEQHVDVLKHKHESEKSQMEEQVREKAAVEEQLRKRVTDLEQENDYFQGELIDSKMKLAELMARNEELSAQFHRVEKDLSELKTKAAEPAPKDSKKK